MQYTSTTYGYANNVQEKVRNQKHKKEKRHMNNTHKKTDK